MKAKEFSLAICLVAVLTTSLILTARSSAQTDSTLHTFTGFNTDGSVGSNDAGTYGGLVADSAGNLYGTTPFGGTSTFCIQAGQKLGCGTAFELSPPAQPGGPWTETILYSFDPNVVGDATAPQGGMVFDKAGNLYGTTNNGQGSFQPGNVFELSPPSQPGGPWTETILYTAPGDGFNTNGGLIIDSAGNLYGTNNEGGTYDRGTVFELSPPSQPGGSWTSTSLYSFGKDHLDGSYPLSGVVRDSKGNLYGTTTMGGTESGPTYGTVYMLKPPPAPGGAWTETVLYRFTGGDDGGDPWGGLLLFKKGLYGTTRIGSTEGGGTVFQLTFAGGTGLTETVLHAFSPRDNNGHDLRDAPIVDAAGNLYGTAYMYNENGAGVVFKLAPPSSGGSWTYSVLYRFTGGSDGGFPVAPLIMKNGLLYGITTQGGDQNCMVDLAQGCGTVFQIAK